MCQNAAGIGLCATRERSLARLRRMGAFLFGEDPRFGRDEHVSFMTNMQKRSVTGVTVSCAVIPRIDESRCVRLHALCYRLGSCEWSEIARQSATLLSSTGLGRALRAREIPRVRGSTLTSEASALAADLRVTAPPATMVYANSCLSSRFDSMYLSFSGSFAYSEERATVIFT
jgi:hypothetical protein